MPTYVLYLNRYNESSLFFIPNKYVEPTINQELFRG